MDRTEAALNTAESARDRAQDSYTALEAQSRSQRSELEAREAAVAAREAAAENVEAEVEANRFSGGVQIVGDTVKPGVYRSGEIADSCYYVWKTGTDADADIVDNNIVDSGTATVTLRGGEVFESRGCGTWTKID